MRVKTFRGRTMAETLEQVKQQFGRDAVILNTRTDADGGVLGIGGKPYVEITAAPESSPLPTRTRRGRIRDGSTATVGAEGAAKDLSPGSTQLSARLSESLLSEMGTLKAVVGDLVRETRRARAADIPGALHDTYARLVENAVAEEIAQQLVTRVRDSLREDQLHDASAVRRELASAVESMLPTAGPIVLASEPGPTIISLVGPTGVGKTTTIAKLAANFSLREGKKVGLITIDTYRIAAVEQLRTYAQIIDVPLEVVMRPAELQDAVTRMADRDVILIDTAGRSQRDTVKIQELHSFFEVVRPHEVHLVVSGTCGEAVLLDAVQRFSAVGIDRVILTKLDEAIGFGVILSCLQRANTRLSYVTTGQNVPDDIRIGEGKTLARLVLGSQVENA